MLFVLRDVVEAHADVRSSSRAALGALKGLLSGDQEDHRAVYRRAEATKAGVHDILVSVLGDYHLQDVQCLSFGIQCLLFPATQTADQVRSFTQKSPGVFDSDKSGAKSILITRTKDATSDESINLVLR